MLASLTNSGLSFLVSLANSDISLVFLANPVKKNKFRLFIGFPRKFGCSRWRPLRKFSSQIRTFHWFPSQNSEVSLVFFRKIRIFPCSPYKLGPSRGFPLGPNAEPPPPSGPAASMAFCMCRASDFALRRFQAQGSEDVCLSDLLYSWNMCYVFSVFSVCFFVVVCFFVICSLCKNKIALNQLASILITCKNKIA